MAMVFGVLAVLFFAYFIGVVLYTGTLLSFSLFWLVLAVLCLGGCIGSIYKKNHPEKLQLPLWCKGMIAGIATTALLTFLVLQGLIISGMFQTAPEQLDYIIVLGAKVRGSVVSDSLERRLQAALTYLQENPHTKVILSGGRGADETITEARAMYRYLRAAEVDPKRMVLEAMSTTTYENIRRSFALIPEDSTVGIVTNDFHVYRAVALAQKQGHEVYGIPASGNPFLGMNNLFREAVAIWKEKFMGNI